MQEPSVHEVQEISRHTRVDLETVAKLVRVQVVFYFGSQQKPMCIIMPIMVQRSVSSAQSSGHVALPSILDLCACLLPGSGLWQALHLGRRHGSDWSEFEDCNAGGETMHWERRGREH